jgi:hypothetical protein
MPQLKRAPRMRRSIDFEIDQYEALKLEAERTRRNVQGLIDFIVDQYLQSVTDVNPLARDMYE